MLCHWRAFLRRVCILQHRSGLILSRFSMFVAPPLLCDSRGMFVEVKIALRGVIKWHGENIILVVRRVHVFSVC